MEDEKYEEALNEFENAQEYIVASPGFQFFSVTQYCIDKATLYRRMGREADAEQLLLKGIQFCEKQGYGFRAEMISRYCNKMEAKPAKWNFLLDGITLKQIENNVESLAVRYSNKRQEHNMEFLSVWQKMVEGYADTTENLVVTSIKTFKKYSPIYKNEKMDSIFVSYSFLRESWNSLKSNMVCDKEELPIFMFFFRELLATIDRLEDKIEISKMNNKYAFDIKRSADTLLSIINEILDSSKIESGKSEIIPVTYEISSLFHDVYNMIHFRAQQKNLELIFDIDKNMPAGLYGDDVRLKQIMVNLLTNAVKYTHEGTVTLSAKSEVKGDTAFLSIKVTDTGIGIKEDINKLFVKFERIEESRNRNIEGTGLGMSITLQLLKLMGSELTVQCEYGKGTEFAFCIQQGITNFVPLGDFNERINQKPGQSNYTLSYVAPNAKILVVDDNWMNRKVFRSLLKKSHMKVSEADCGMSCIEMLKEQKFDLVFLDYMMPMTDGIETLKEIKNQHLCDGVPIISLTANAVVGAKEEFLSAGFDDYLTKPIVPEKLDRMILSYLPKIIYQKAWF